MTGRRPQAGVPDPGASQAGVLQAVGGQPVAGPGRVGPARHLAARARARGGAPRHDRIRAAALPGLRGGDAVAGAAAFQRRPGPRAAAPERHRGSVDGPDDRVAGRGDQRLGLRARGARQQPGPALGLPAHGGRRLRDAEGEPGGIPAPDAAPPAPRRRAAGGVRHVGRALRPPLGVAPVPLSGREPRGLPHAGRGRRGAGGAATGRPADAVAPELAVLRRDRRGPRRAPLVPDLHGARLEREQAGHRPRGQRGLSRPGVDHRPAGRQQPRAAAAHPGGRGVLVGALPDLPPAPPGLPPADAGGAGGSGGSRAIPTPGTTSSASRMPAT